MNNVLEVNDEAKNGEAFMSALSISFGSTTWLHKFWCNHTPIS